MSRDDFDIPDLGPAEPERITPQNGSGSGNNGHAEPPRNTPQTESSGGGWFQTLLLILLVAGCSGLGYWTLTLMDQLKAEQKNVAELQGQMQEMRELLNMAESSAEKSGNTMLDKLGDMSRTAQGKYAHFDSEIAKLWTVAHQRNKPEIEKQGKKLGEQDKVLSAQKAQLAKLDKSLAALDKKLKTLDRSQKSLNGKLVAAEKAQKAQAESNNVLADKVKADLAKVKADAVKVQIGVRMSEEAMQEEQNTLKNSMRKLTDRIAALENTQRKNALERRVKVNEDAIDAFDATRRELNRNLLQIKKRLNSLQLAVEKQSKLTSAPKTN